MNCFERIKDKNLVKHLLDRTGLEEKESYSPDEIKKLTEASDNILNEDLDLLNDTYADLGVSGYKKIAQPPTVSGVEGGDVDFRTDLKSKGFSVADRGGYDKNGVNIAFKTNSVLGVDKYGDPFFVDSPNKTDIVLQEIKVVDEAVRGKGEAQKALKEFLDSADKTNSTVYLEPEPIARLKNEKNLTREQLIKWYEKNGFVKVNDSIWKREPQEQSTKVEEQPPTVMEQEAEKPTIRVTAEQLEERQPQNIRQRYIDDFNIVESSAFDWRVTSELSTKDRLKAVEDIKAGKETAAAKKLNKEIDDMMTRGTVIINRGRGTQAQTVEIPVDEWFKFTPIEQNEAIKETESTPDNVISIIRDEGITLQNIDNLKELFNGFPYDETDFTAVKNHLQREVTRTPEAERISQKGQKEITGETIPPTPEGTKQVPPEKKTPAEAKPIEAGKEAAPPKQPPVEPPKEPVGGGEMAGITHEAMDVIARELGLPEYKKDPQTEEQWIRDADERLKQPGEMDRLITKMEKNPNYQPDPVENTMAKRYIASLKAKINAKPTKDLLQKLDRAREAFNLAGRAWGLSGKSRQGFNQVEDTLADYLVDRSKDKGKPLSDEQIEKETEKYNKLKAEKDKLEQALKEEKEKYDRLAAEKGVTAAKAAARKAAKKSHEDYVKEREDLKKSIRDKWKSAGKDILSSDIPFRKQLSAIAPDVKKYMQSLVNEGIEKLDDIVNTIHEDFKDFLTKGNIIEIISGQHDEKGETRAQKANRLRLLKREAELIKELQDARRGIEKEKSERRRDEKERRITELEQKIKETRELNKEKLLEEDVEEKSEFKSDEERDAAYRKRLLKKIERLQDDIRNKKYEPEPKPEVQFKKSFKTQQLEDKVIQLENQLNHDRVLDRLAKRTKGEKIYDFITREILGVKRLAQTILDVSIWFRQTIRIALNPLKWDVFGKEVAKSWKSIWNQKVFDRYMSQIHKDPEFKEMTDDGIRFNEFETTEIQRENEFYYKNWMFRVPYLRHLILASQRGADAALNVSRYELYKKYKKRLIDNGVTRESDPEAYKSMADEVMNQTGSGKLLSWLEKNVGAQKTLGNTFYGARLMAANFNQLNPYYYAKMNPEMRKILWKDISSYVGTTMALGAAALAAGATVSFDPDDPDFLQVRFGDKVYDITGGKAAYIRTALRIFGAMFATGKKIAGTATAYEMNKKWENASKSTFKFFRNKLAPNTSYAYTWTFGAGKDYIGRNANPLEIVQIYPMYFDDAWKGFQEDGISSLGSVVVPNLLGVGYNRYFMEVAKQDLSNLIERNARSKEMNKETIKNYKAGGREITNKEFKAFVEKRDDYLIRRLTEFYDKGLPVIENNTVIVKPFDQLTDDEIIAETSKIKAQATREIKEELFGKDIKTKKEKQEDKRLDDAYKKMYPDFYKK